MWPFTHNLIDEPAINKVTAFHQLELYAFLMADQFIDVANAPNQAQLIHLIYSLNKTPDTTCLDQTADFID